MGVETQRKRAASMILTRAINLNRLGFEPFHHSDSLSLKASKEPQKKPLSDKKNAFSLPIATRNFLNFIEQNISELWKPRLVF
jgi:hypothetical protein